MKHELKILPRYYKAIINNKKTFELRKNKNNYKVGDILILKEYKNEIFTGNECQKKITYILKNVENYGLKKGFVILSLK